MSTELLPEKGVIEAADGVYYSASAIAAMSIKGFPKTRAGVYKRAEKEGWPVLHHAGRGARDGVQYFKLPEGIVRGVQSASAGADRKPFKTEPVKAFTTGSGVSSALLADSKSRDDDKVFVKRYVDVKGSAGPGYHNDTDGLIELVEFNAGALRNFINVPAQHLVIGGVDGYSMEPFLFHGDQVFIDTRYQTFQNDGVYALLHNGELRYKRVRINYADKTVLLKSDNDGGLGPEVLNEDQANSLRIIGKVIPFKFGHFKL